jgi:hypothetical protein
MPKAEKQATGGGKKKADKIDSDRKQKSVNNKGTSKQAGAAGKATAAASKKSAVVKKSAMKKAAVAKKTAAKQSTSAKKVVAKKKTTAPKRATSSARGSRAAAARTLTRAERHALISEAAYLRSEANGFLGDPCADWLEAEREVDARLQATGTAILD